MRPRRAVRRASATVERLGGVRSAPRAHAEQRRIAFNGVATSRGTVTTEGNYPSHRGRDRLTKEARRRRRLALAAANFEIGLAKRG